MIDLKNDGIWEVLSGEKTALKYKIKVKRIPEINKVMNAINVTILFFRTENSCRRSIKICLQIIKILNDIYWDLSKDHHTC